MKKYDVVIAGYLCMDLVPDFKGSKSPSDISELLKPGKLIEINGMRAILGGVVANTGIAMKKFSKKVFLNGATGDDIIGQMVRHRLNEYELDGDIQVMNNEGTAFSIVLAPPGVDRIFLESPGCSRLFDQSCVNFDAIAESRLFHFGYPPLLRQFYIDKGTQLINLFSEIQEMDVITCMDFSLPSEESEAAKVNWPMVLSRALPYTDIFVPSLQEAMQIMMPSIYSDLKSSANGQDMIDAVSVETIRNLGKQIMDAGVKIAMIKAGHRGAYVCTGDVTSISEKAELRLTEDLWNQRELWCDAYPIKNSKIQNASGAGDTAVAVFLSAILDGQPPGPALKYASIAGRNSLYCDNIHGELGDWPELTKGIKAEANPIKDFKTTKNDISDLND